MQVYKFGGASVKDAQAVKNVISILKENPFKEKVVVISAMGKTTNDLEKVINEYYAHNTEWKNSIETVYTKHLAIISELFENQPNTCDIAVRKIIDKTIDFLSQNHSRNYNFIYDQVVSIGEYISTTIVSEYANHQSVTNTLVDAKHCIFTDNAYTEGKIDWKKTEKAISTVIPPLFETGFVITQGFVGCTQEDFTTTLGREGSDYTAAIFSYCLNAERMTVWKDVEGIMNADPKEFPEATFISELTFTEAIEMTYYGASVIHPKTIKPIQNRNIPLEVRSFVNYNKRGSIISANANTSFLPPIIIHKRNQVLLSFSAKDFSFIGEDHLSKVFSTFADLRLRINMMQNAAISFSICVDYKKEKIDAIIDELSNDFSIVQNEKLSLLTIRHFNQGIIDKLTKEKDILIRQISRNTIQVLMRE
ncbi:MAG: aspartate kinase [Chitinophagales bacterium]|nr:aspartate kinase [Chitinophagales bacterium]